MKNAVVFFTPSDLSAALEVANELGWVGIFCRHGMSYVHPEAMAANQVFTIGGPRFGHPNEVYMSGSGTLDTFDVVIEKTPGQTIQS